MTRRTTGELNASSLLGPWAERALCAEADPDAWYPEHHVQALVAKRIFAACPVHVQCLEYALPGADTGAGSRPASGAALPRVSAPDYASLGRRLQHDESAQRQETTARDGRPAGPLPG